MSWKDIVIAVREMILNSELEMKNVDWHQVGKYLAVMMSKDEIQQEGLQHVIPKRRGEIRIQRRITIRFLQAKKNDQKWLPGRRPGVRQKQKMLGLAVSYGVYTCLSHHTYKAVARPFMMRWDRLYLN